MTEDPYTAELSKGQALIDETVLLLEEWFPSLSATDLCDRIHAQGILGKATKQRTYDIVVRSFASRFMGDVPMSASRLKRLAERGFGRNDLSQLFLVYTCRANAILRGFLEERYWPAYGAGANEVTREEALKFIAAALDEGRMASRWSDSTRTRIARYMMSTLAEFGLLGPDCGGRRRVMAFAISSLTVLYLAHEFHFLGLDDNSIVEHRDWRIFGLTRGDTVRQLERAGRTLGLIVQDTGELTRIAWTTRSMEEFLDAIPR
jgi:hypothetical protein